ncbi:signal peptidase I [Agromyces archimandritae]|uniref:Signal peptidase I n=1 Tax=Agromyces archimandritae TaxID=2781962 RepID=A0A975FJS7_9MICO|nr:signal peptidase I [Agromyces archimandritae]QTX03325.1 signal peptidase I [Agromyces archimandritae]
MTARSTPAHRLEGKASRRPSASETDPRPEALPRAEAQPRPMWLRVLGAVRQTLLTAAAVLGGVSILVFAGGLLLGIRPVVVISGSMEPVLPVGSVALIKSVDYDEVAVGDIVTVQRPRGLGLVTHRVVEKTTIDGSPALELKGDANRTADPDPYPVDTVSRMVLSVPGLGHIAIFLQNGNGFMAAAGIFLTLVSVYLLDPEKILHAQTGASRRSGPRRRTSDFDNHYQ